jgi:hypothetical protein
MNFIRSTPPGPTSSGGTITNPCGHRPTQIRPFPMYGVGGSPLGGRGPPDRVTGQPLSAKLGGTELVLVGLGAADPDGGAVDRPTEQPAAPSTRHEIRSALRTNSSLPERR